MGLALNVSGAVAIGLHAMAELASEGGRTMTSVGIASGLGVSPDHTRKVMQRLARAGLVLSARGPGGGYTLARDPGEITLEEVHEAIEGELPRGRCLLGSSSCRLEECPFGELLSEVNGLVGDFFRRRTVADLLAGRGSG